MPVHVSEHLALSVQPLIMDFILGLMGKSHPQKFFLALPHFSPVGSRGEV